MAFSKMHGAGNDYIYIDATKQIPSDLSDLARKMSDVHFGIGSDGLVAILNSDVADFRMRMFNSDGSEAEMCGNATRCIAKYVYEKGLTDKTTITLETLAGVKILYLSVSNGVVDSVTVDMGAPQLKPELVPVASANPEIKIAEIETIGNKAYKITGVSMGNPHGVIFVDDITDEMVLEEGPVLEVADIFPRKANIEFAKVIDRNKIEMRVWERGTGETFACGTGACATAVAGVLNGLTDRKVELKLKGGSLFINWDEETGHVLMTGPAAFICDGVFYL
ncbi:MAG: diaminopimelate epimerase [Bacteroidales bacterium]|nr:diaminopimelate epimerase [Bacteroidales bacterium]MBD5223547.1 diaminopimelate epimerase [Bacteroidales bacterium]MBD5302525.1 diaminopimelate epimerase [Bacteroides sp.]